MSKPIRFHFVEVILTLFGLILIGLTLLISMYSLLVAFIRR